MQRVYLGMRRVGGVVVCAAVMFLVQTPLWAAGTDAAISQGFSTSEELGQGTLVSLTEDAAKGAVVAANTDNGERLVGIVSDSSLVELSGTTNEVQVATSGTAYAFVSDINGEIKRGDKIAPSPVSGIGMKATESSQVLGTAGEDSSTAKLVSTRVATDRNGIEHTITIRLMTTQINVAYFQKPEDTDSFLPSFLTQFANAVVGRDVAPIRVLLSLVLLVAGFGGVAVLLYSSVRSSIISIGRNPLSSDAVHKGMFEVAGLALGILMVMLIAVYLVLVI